MISKATIFTDSLLYLCTFLFLFFGLLAFISLIKPSYFRCFSLPKNRFIQFTILFILSLSCLAIAHILVPSGFP